jgi:hypothetical protein
MARRECRDCGAEIEWDKKDGRWIPCEPGSVASKAGAKRHVCALTQTCEDCGSKFEGPNWMKVCPECYRGAGKGGASHAEKAPVEPLKPGGDGDGDPF